MAFSGQAAISLTLAIWVFFLSRHRRLEVQQHDDGTAEHAVEVKRLESALDILMVGNDIQMLTGKDTSVLLHLPRVKNQVLNLC